MVLKKKVSHITAVVLLCCCITFVCMAKAAEPDAIKIVTDDNYPPYIFRDQTGTLQGILIDQWALWSQKTGKKIQVTAMDWEKAQIAMKNGEFDVIDTIFVNEERQRLFDFSRPYATIDVAIFFHRNIGGIEGLNTLKGFKVGVKSGDDAVNSLFRSDIHNVVLFDSYEAMVQAASRNELVVFVMDKPPALYFLNKLGLQDKFNASPAINSGQFYRAVKKGDTELLAVIESGFANISATEYEAINKRWFGETLDKGELGKWVLIVLAVAGIILIVLTFLNYGLKKAVGRRTAELQAFVNAIPDLMFTLRRDGNFVRYRNSCENRDFERAEVNGHVGRNIVEMFPPEIAKEYLERMDATLGDKEVQAFEYQLLSAEDTAFYEARIVASSTDEVLAIVRDISERKQAEIALRHSSEIQVVLREIADAATLSSSLDELYRTAHHLMGRVLPAQNLYISLLDEENGQIVRPYGADEVNLIPRARPVGKGLTEYFMQAGRVVHLTSALYNQLRETGEIDLYSAPVFECIGAPLQDSQGKVFGVLTLYLDDDIQRFAPKDSEVLSIIAAQVAMAITRRKAEETMVESEARYRAVIEQAPDAIVLCDPDTGAILESNRRFAEWFGYELRREDPLTVYSLIDDEAENIRFRMEQLKQSGISSTSRRLFKHRNGVKIHVERSAAMIRYLGRTAFLMTIRNVSDEVQREQELKRDVQLAQRAQNALLSMPEPSDFLEISTVYQPFGYVGGDLYFMDWRYGGNLLRGFLVDATGQGLSTALHTASLHVLLREVNGRDLPLADAIRWLNRRAGEYFDEGSFAGALGFELDLQTRELRWVCAGIPKIMVSTQKRQGALECPGMCLGINESETFETHTLTIEVGDCFYFLTDGLSYLLDPRIQLPLDRYVEMVGLLRTLSESETRRDDATAVCIRVNSLPDSSERTDGWPRVLRFNGYGDYQRLKGEVAKILAEVTGLPHSPQEVAVHEALANAMECRDGVPRQHKARLRFNRVGNRLIVRVKTSRIGFAGNAILKRLRSQPEDMFSFGEDASMGRGIPMMLSMTDKMTYNSEGTEVLLSWRL